MDHIDRMKTELEELTVKMNALQDFIGDEDGIVNTLPAIEQRLLISQVTAMATYANILGTRLSLIGEQK